MDLPLLEELEKEEALFKKFSFVGTDDVEVAGNLKTGYTVNVRRVGGGATGTSPVGACCVDSTCSIQTEAACEELLGGVYQGDGTGCDPNPCPECVVTFNGFQTGCRGTGSGVDYAAAWADAFTNWGSCAGSSSGGGLAFGFKSGISFQAEADDQPMRFTLTASPSGNATISGTIRTYDDLAGLVDSTPFSFTLTGIGDTHDLTFTPIEPVDPVGGVPNSTHSVAEDLAYDCSPGCPEGWSFCHEGCSNCDENGCCPDTSPCCLLDTTYWCCPDPDCTCCEPGDGWCAFETTCCYYTDPFTGNPALTCCGGDGGFTSCHECGCCASTAECCTCPNPNWEGCDPDAICCNTCCYDELGFPYCC